MRPILNPEYQTNLRFIRSVSNYSLKSCGFVDFVILTIYITSFMYSKSNVVILLLT